MTREEAFELVKSLVKNENLVKHHLAVEAVMRALAQRFGEDEETWGLVGLLHDADYEITGHDSERHGRVMADMLRERGVEEVVIEGVMAHNEALGVPRDTNLKKAIYACDELTGLIIAAALVHPEKRLAPLDTKFIMNRFKEKSFARGARREQILTSTELGMELEEFTSVCLEAMKGVAADLGL